MDKRYAIVNASGLVEAVIVWDGENDWVAPDGFEAIQTDEAGIGWSYQDGQFIAPPPEPLPVPSPEEILSANTRTRDSLLSLAALDIAPLQDAVDLDEATTEEVALLKVWKQYRVAVNRIDLTISNPTWPSPPPHFGGQ